MFAQKQNYLNASGNKLIDQRGQEVRMTGVNWFGFETETGFPHGVWTRDMKSVLQQIKDLGFNTIRVPWANEILFGSQTISINSYGTDAVSGVSPMNEEESKVSTPLELLDIFVDWCQENDLKIVLDNHTRKPDSHLTEGLWYTPEFSEEQWIEDWVKLAERYKGKSTVVAMDLNNEPFAGTWGNSNPATDWNKAAERCGNAILEVNPEVLIMVEGVSNAENSSYWWGGNLKGAKPYPIVLSNPKKLIYSAHEYGPEVSAQSWFKDPSFPDNMPALWKEHFDFLVTENEGPLLIGEFGIRDEDNQIAQTWIREFMKFGGNRYSWTFWAMNPNSGDTGGILQNDWTTVNQWKLDILNPYRAAIIPNVVNGDDNSGPVDPPAPAKAVGGILTGGPFNFTVGDGTPDFMSNIKVEGNSGENTVWALADVNNKVLAIPENPETIDFDGTEPGICILWHVSYNGTLENLVVGDQFGDIDGEDFAVVKDPIQINRTAVIVDPPAPAKAVGGILTGGPFNFTVGDGTPDFMSNIKVEGNSGENTVWALADVNNKVLAIPENPETIDFDGTEPGICILWHVSYNGTLENLVVGEQFGDIDGEDFAVVKDPIQINKTAADVTPPVTGGCDFNAPSANPLPNTSGYYSNLFVIGNGGPSMDNFSGFAFNWDLNNKGLYNFAIQTNNGVPAYYVDLKSKITQNFDQANPQITIDDSGFPGLDGSYYVVNDGENLVFKSVSEQYTLYFTSSETGPGCSGAKKIGKDIIFNISTYPNPINTSASASVTVDSTISLKGSKITLTTIDGKIISSAKVVDKTNTHKLSVTNLTSGLYLVQIITNSNDIRVIKLVIK